MLDCYCTYDTLRQPFISLALIPHSFPHCYYKSVGCRAIPT
nr:MAG TPA: hypothetical protein [Caudoviricetes sp.]